MKDVFKLFQNCFPEFPISEELFMELLTSSQCRIQKKRIHETCAGVIVWEADCIRLLLVAPEFRMQGIGTELLASCEHQINSSGFSTIYLGGNNAGLFHGAVITREEWLHNTSDFFSKRGYHADHTCIEMCLFLEKFQSIPLSVRCPSDIRFEYYSGNIEKLQAAVMSVDNDWIPYFTSDQAIFTALCKDEIAAFCLLDFDEHTLLSCYPGRVGSIGCVGTIPNQRGQGIGLAMVQQATLELIRHGCSISWIHDTYLEQWYGRLGYQTYLYQWYGQKP